MAYLAKADTIPHRAEGAAELVAHLPERVERVLDLGTGDGRLLDLVLTARPGSTGVGLDLNAEMLVRARNRFAGDDRVEIAEHDLDDALPGGRRLRRDRVQLRHPPRARRPQADALRRVLRPARARAGRSSTWSTWPARPRASTTPFWPTLDIDPADDDPSNLLAPVEDQLEWLRAAGFTDVDCHWKWRELALLAGVRPT